MFLNRFRWLYFAVFRTAARPRRVRRQRRVDAFEDAGRRIGAVPNLGSVSVLARLRARKMIVLQLANQVINTDNLQCVSDCNSDFIQHDDNDNYGTNKWTNNNLKNKDACCKIALIKYCFNHVLEININTKR